MFSFLLAYIAGIVSILSPCVLPLLPIILVGSLDAHKKGPLMLSLGLVTSFTLFGLFFATIGLSMGLNQAALQAVTSTLMIIFGLVMVSDRLYQKFSSVMSWSVSGVHSKISLMNFNGLKGQYILGILLGTVWVPCVGPTLGAAIGLAAQGEQLIYAASIMLVFSLGIATPVLAMGMLSQKSMHKFKAKLMKGSGLAKTLLGVLFIGIGLLILSGGLIQLENFLINNVFPGWLIDFIYSF
ncbi:MAG TPA: cytochrome C biogenesis protein [Alphaproteobacteria bacterium]|nr:cytochrome C biogenesis protein [Alphaproteobacteria bacterium]